MKAVDSRQQEITNILKKVYDEFPDKDNQIGFLNYVHNMDRTISRKKIMDFLRSTKKNPAP